jgi:thiazole synthase
MEMGADAVLINTAIATAVEPAKMAQAFKLAVEAGRMAYLSGAAAESKKASPSSPLTGFLRNE